MKFKIGLLAAIAISLSASAQTNIVIFNQLLSPSNTVLMTNAEFRCYSGSKIFFKNDNGYQAFHAFDLSSNVLVALHTSPAQLDAQQQALDAANARYKANVAAYWAEKEQAKELALKQREAATERARQRMAANPPVYVPNHVTDRESVGLGP